MPEDQRHTLLFAMPELVEETAELWN